MSIELITLEFVTYLEVIWVEFLQLDIDCKSAFRFLASTFQNSSNQGKQNCVRKYKTIQAAWLPFQDQIQDHHLLKWAPRLRTDISSRKAQFLKIYSLACSTGKPNILSSRRVTSTHTLQGKFNSIVI